MVLSLTTRRTDITWFTKHSEHKAVSTFLMTMSLVLEQAMANMNLLAGWILFLNHAANTQAAGSKRVRLLAAISMRRPPSAASKPTKKHQTQVTAGCWARCGRTSNQTGERVANYSTLKLFHDHWQTLNQKLAAKRSKELLISKTLYIFKRNFTKKYHINQRKNQCKNEQRLSFVSKIESMFWWIFCCAAAWVPSVSRGSPRPSQEWGGAMKVNEAMRELCTDVDECTKKHQMKVFLGSLLVTFCLLFGTFCFLFCHLLWCNKWSGGLCQCDVWCDVMWCDVMWCDVMQWVGGMGYQWCNGMWFCDDVMGCAVNHTGRSKPLQISFQCVDHIKLRVIGSMLEDDYN